MNMYENTNDLEKLSTRWSVARELASEIGRLLQIFKCFAGWHRYTGFDRVRCEWCGRFE